MTGPISGIVFERGSLHPVLGVPGSSYLGPALLKGVDLAEASPDGRWVAFARSGQIAVLSLADGVERVLASGSSRKMAWSAQGNALAFENEGQVWWWRVSAELATPLGQLSDVTDLVADADGEFVFAAVGGAESGVYRLQANSPPQRLATLEGGGWLSWDPSQRSLFACDQRGVWEVGWNGGAVRLASQVRAPAGLAVSGDNRYIVVADQALRAVLIYDRFTKALLEQHELSFAPTRLKPLGAKVFLLNERSETQPLEALSMDAGTQVFFIPAGVQQ
ncbi:MAG: lactonase family protein [Bryobacteraceae bacterium]|nr:lactonase family protein [Bryobacteraceae bacterium]MDW8378745.1 hypothetical protein [Bryobacterales bacterium]